MLKVKTALLSVTEKKGIAACGQQLHELGIKLIASKGTASLLREHQIPVTDVAEFIALSTLKQTKDIFQRLGVLEEVEVKVGPEKFPEKLREAVAHVGEPILDRRVVTLTQQIHGALLARLDLVKHLDELERVGVPPIELVIVDFYPLKNTIAAPGSTFELVIEATDIGGPTQARSAAKGMRLVVCDPVDRQRVVNAIKRREDLDVLALELGAKAEAVVADYCLTSARFRSQGGYDGIIGRRVATCKYGENPYQVPAALYTTDSDDPLAHDKFKLVEGTEPSFVGNTDRERLLQTITHIAAGFEANGFPQPAIAVAVKHGNACGAAVSADPLEAIGRMVSGDPLAIFGGVVMTNFAIDTSHAEALLYYGLVNGQERRLLDGVIAPRFSEAAVEVLARKKGKCRLVTNLALEHLGVVSLDTTLRFSYLRGGFQLQPNYTFVLNFMHPQLTVHGARDDAIDQDILLAWAIGCTSNSNTITLVHNGQLIGNGVGQQDRVGACKLAVERATRAGHNPLGSVAYSDSFFPFVDGPAVLYDAGVSAIFASSGSIRYDEVREFCQQKGITLYVMPDAVCRGFFGH